MSLFSNLIRKALYFLIPASGNPTSRDTTPKTSSESTLFQMFMSPDTCGVTLFLGGAGAGKTRVLNNMMRYFAKSEEDGIRATYTYVSPSPESNIDFEHDRIMNPGNDILKREGLNPLMLKRGLEVGGKTHVYTEVGDYQGMDGGFGTYTKEVINTLDTFLTDRVDGNHLHHTIILDDILTLIPASILYEWLTGKAKKANVSIILVAQTTNEIFKTSEDWATRPQVMNIMLSTNLLFTRIPYMDDCEFISRHTGKKIQVQDVLNLDRGMIGFSSPTGIFEILKST